MLIILRPLSQNHAVPSLNWSENSYETWTGRKCHRVTLSHSVLVRETLLGNNLCANIHATSNQQLRAWKGNWVIPARARLVGGSGSRSRGQNDQHARLTWILLKTCYQLDWAVPMWLYVQSTMADLMGFLVEELDRLPQSCLQCLVRSIQYICEACIAVDGGAVLMQGEQ